MDFPDEKIMTLEDVKEVPKKYWRLYFDGALNSQGRGVGIVLISLEGVIIKRWFELHFKCTNNIAEYEGLLLGVRLAEYFEAKYIEVVGDSLLVINQANLNYRCKAPRLVTYRDHVTYLLSQFKGVKYWHVPRSKNILAYALFSLGSSLQFSSGADSKAVFFQKVPELSVFSKETWLKKLREYYEVARLSSKRQVALIEEVNDDNPWFYDIKNFIEK